MGSSLGPLLLSVLRENAAALEAGAIVTVDESRNRVRVLPLG